LPIKRGDLIVAKNVLPEDERLQRIMLGNWIQQLRKDSFLIVKTQYVKSFKKLIKELEKHQKEFGIKIIEKERNHTVLIKKIEDVEII